MLAEAERKEETGKRRGKWFWIVRLAPAVLAVAVVVLACGLVSSHNARKALRDEVELQKIALEEMRKKAGETEEEGWVQDTEPVITGSVLKERLDSLQELVTTEYNYTNAGQYESNRQISIVDWELGVPFTSKSFLVTYDGCIRAGVDLSGAETDVDEKTHTVTVTLPACRIFSHEVYEDSVMVLNESDGLFNRITIENYTEFISLTKADMEEKAIGRGLLESAGREAKATVKAFLSLLPGMDRYTLAVRQRDGEQRGTA